MMVASGRPMPELICKLDERPKKSMQQAGNSWRLMRGDNGELFIKHDWSRTRVKTLGTDEGTKRMTIAAFLGNTHPLAAGARKALSRYLKEHPDT